jgi:hypothetical protein
MKVSVSSLALLASSIDATPLLGTGKISISHGKLFPSSELLALNSFSLLLYFAKFLQVVVVHKTL